MRRISLLLIALLVLSGTSASAQVRSVELIPFGGYRWSGGLSSLTLLDLDVKDAAAYGICLDFNMAYSSAAELYWSHWSGDWEATDPGAPVGQTPYRTGSFSRDDIMLAGIWYATRSGAVARPYFTAGLGTSIFYADNADTEWRFAWDIGAGVRKDVNEKFGLRVDFRWVPTWVTTGTSTWCDPYWGCYPANTGEFFDQWELTGGLIIKLGGRG